VKRAARFLNGGFGHAIKLSRPPSRTKRNRPVDKKDIGDGFSREASGCRAWCCRRP
jgi:hypothetical protein